MLRWWRDAVEVVEGDGVEVVCCLLLVVVYCDSHLLVLLVCGGLRPHISGIQAAEKRRERR